MSIPKVAGLETEYGITIHGDERPDPLYASRLLLAAYQQIGEPNVSCRSSASSTALFPDITLVQKSPSEHEGATGERLRPAFSVDSAETDLMLTSGARFYIDLGHPEYSAPECLSPRLLVAADKAGERILELCQHWINSYANLPQKQRLAVYKNNSDFKNNSYGCHENYLLSSAFFTTLQYRKVHHIFCYILPFFITRVILCGAGKVGSENGSAPVGFQLSQRADFFEQLIGIQTTHRRPLFNTRDEPHSDHKRFRRLHVIIGDANMAEMSTYLKIGVTQLVLSMLEDEFMQINLMLSNPLEAMHTVSRDLTFRKPLLLEDGRKMTAVEIQKVYLHHVQRYLKRHGGATEQWDVYREWAYVLSKLPNRWNELAMHIDWAIKRFVLEEFLQSERTSWDEVAAWQPIIALSADSEQARQMATRARLSWDLYSKQRKIYYRLRRLDLDYHDIRHRAEGGEMGLFYRLQHAGTIERILSDTEIDRLCVEPPADTRSWLRGQCIARFAGAISSADWEHLHFDPLQWQLNQEPVLSLLDPLSGTEQIMAPYWEHIVTPSLLLEYWMSSIMMGDKKYV